MTGRQSLSVLERRIGYTFTDQSLLTLALTHKSHGRDNNERLEFLGDAVLGYVIGGLLYRTNQNWREDALSLGRAQLVRGSTLAEVATEIGLGDFVLLGSGERRSGGSDRHSILADTLEALIGAVHEDGGISEAIDLVNRLFTSRAETVQPDQLKDPKTTLQELLQGHGRPLPEYEVVEVSGEAHAREYSVQCTLADDELTGTATASSRREAEKLAAKIVINLLEDRSSE